MIECGRFGLRPLNDSGEDFVTRMMLAHEIQAAVAEGRSMTRAIQSMQDSGRDTNKMQAALGTLNLTMMAKSVEMLEASIVTLDGVPVDMEDAEDAARVRKALGKLSRADWDTLMKSFQAGDAQGDGEDKAASKSDG